MAERLVRLYGPSLPSDSLTSPSTLFSAVPQGKSYIVRQISAVLPPSSGAAPTVSFLAGIDTLDTENLIAGLAITGSTTGATTSTVDLVTPITTGESLVGACMSGSTADPARTDYAASDTATWNGVSSTTDATSYTTAAFTPQAHPDPANVFFFVTNTKASSPNVVSAITDNGHTNGFTDAASIVTATTGPDRVSIWGGYLGAQASGSDDWTVNFGGGNTQTSCKAKAVVINNSSIAIGSPGTANVVLQTATNTGTTATAQGVTMTPSAGDTFQLFVVQCSAVASSYTAPTNGTELADGTTATPSSTSAAYLIYPSVTNPSATIASAGTTFAVACIEIAASGAPTIVVSGLVIE